MKACLSVSVYMSVSVIFFLTGSTLVKNKTVKMMFVGKCHRKVLLQKLYSVSLTNIFYFKCLQYIKFVRFHTLQEAKIIGETKSEIHIQAFAIKWYIISPVYLLCDLDLQFRFQMFKICEID